METAIDGFQGPPGPPLRQHPGARHRQALRRRRAHDVRHRLQRPDHRHLPDRPGRGPGQPPHVRRLALAPYVPAVRRHHVGAVMPSYSDVDWTERRSRQPGQHAREPGADHRLAQAAGGLQGHRHLRLQRHRPHRPDQWHLRRPGRRRGQRGHRHVHAAAELRGLRVDPHRAGAGRRRCRWRASTTPYAGSCRVKFQLGLFEHPLHRPHPPARRRQRRTPRRRAASGLGVAGAAEEPARTPCRCVPSRPVYVAGQQRRQHGQPGRRLDAAVAGRLEQRDPGPDDPRRHREPGQQRDLQPGRLGTRAERAVGVVVVGETPYAEGVGDVGQPGHTMELVGMPTQARSRRCARLQPGASCWSCRAGRSSSRRLC